MNNGWIKIWLKRLAPTLVLLVAVLGVIGISTIPRKHEKVQAKPPPPVPVEVLKIVPITADNAGPQADLLRDSFELLGRVQPNRVVDVSAEVAAKVEALPKEKGQTVKKGDLLVELNTDLLKADLDREAAEVRFAQSEMDRVQALQQRGAATANEVDTARTRLEVSQAELATAQAHMQRSRIFAPFDGMIDQRFVEVGAYLQVGMPVARIVDSSIAKVAVDVPERDIQFVRLGQKQQIVVETSGSISGTRPIVLEGTVTYVSKIADPQTHSTRIEISVPNVNGHLRAGQMVNVRLTRQMLSRLVMVPLRSVIPLEEGKQVFVVEKIQKQDQSVTGQAVARNVELGIIRGESVQVLSGLDEGDMLIVEGNRYVGQGQSVDVVNGGSIPSLTPESFNSTDAPSPSDRN